MLFYCVLSCFCQANLQILSTCLTKKTKISGAFLGGVLLAAVTSLPEFFTAISAVTIVNSPELVIGDILGSDIFNLTVLALLTISFYRHFKTSKIDKWHFVSLIVLIAMYCLTAYAIFAPVELQPMLGSINAISIVILAIYVVLIVKQPKESEEHHDDIDSKLTVKQIVVLFVVFSLLLIVASVLITYTTDLITKEIPWLGGTVAGAILLGVATSLPFDKKNSVTNVTELSNHCSGDSFFFKRCTNYCNNLTC